MAGRLLTSAKNWGSGRKYKLSSVKRRYADLPATMCNSFPNGLLCCKKWPNFLSECASGWPFDRHFFPSAAAVDDFGRNTDWWSNQSTSCTVSNANANKKETRKLGTVIRETLERFIFGLNSEALRLLTERDYIIMLGKSGRFIF